MGAGNNHWSRLPGTRVVGLTNQNQNQHHFLVHQDSSEPSSMSSTPCLDILLSENILAHILAASRMPVSAIIFLYIIESVLETPQALSLSM